MTSTTGYFLLPTSLLLLLCVLTHCTFSSGPRAHYKQQVILVLDDDPTVQKIGRMLYQNHDTLSRVLMWNETLEAFELVKWNTESERYDFIENTNQSPLPIGPQKSFAWSDTVIQAVGNGEQATTTLSELSAEELVQMIIGGLTNGDISRVNIIECSSLTLSPQQVEPPVFLSQFMEKLKELQRFETSASLSSVLVAMDHSGRELTGQLLLSANGTDIEWRHDDPADMWIGTFTEQNYQIQKSPTTTRNTPLKSHFFGVLPEGAQVHITDYQEKTSHPLTYLMSDTQAFGWVDRIAEIAYMGIPHSRASTVTRRVQFLSGARSINDVRLIEIGSIADLLKELRYYGNRGPADLNTKVYYRFGDWVVSMNEVNFNVRVEGVITDPVDAGLVNRTLAQWRPIPSLYSSLQSLTGDGFFEDVTVWINGDNDDIGLEMENAYNAQCGVAMFLSEPVKSFHTHITNMMSLDLARHGYLSKDYFFSSHPMAREGTWLIEDPKIGKRKTGMSTLRDEQARSGTLPDEDAQRMFDEIVNRFSRISKSWLSHVDTTRVRGSRDPPPATTKVEYTGTPQQTGILSSVQDIGSIAPKSRVYLREYELSESATRHLSLNISEPETVAVDIQLDDFSDIDEVSLPLKASIALANDHAYVSDLISQELHLKQQQTGKLYEVIPDSVDVEEDSDIVKFFVREVGNVSAEIEQITTVFDQSKLQSKQLLEALLNISSKTRPILKWLKKGEKFTNAVIGLVNSIHELEDGHVLSGTISLAKNLKALGDVTGISKVASKFLGKALKKLANKAGESVASGVIKKTEKTVLSTVGKFKALEKEFAPFIKALWGIYDVYQDLKRHTTIGYIDAAFDIATTVLSFFGPEAAPFVAALSIIKMAVDYFYTDISKELHALPHDASVGQVVVAVLKGIIEGLEDFVKDIINNIDPFAIIGRCHDLDQQYDKDQQFLAGMANYANYYNIVHGPNSTEINFLGGADSWNGGDITFRLGEDGTSTLTLEDVDSNGNQRQDIHTIDTHGVEDIVMGIGESHSVSFKTVTVKALWLIPVDSKRIISGIQGEKQTLHGTYYGNSHNNKFIAVQELPPSAIKQLGYNLYDYHYTLYGGGGNDSFYLGPQPTYVEGNEGSDSYFINSTSTITEINSHSGDGQDDIMIINLDFDQITAKRDGLNLNLTSSNTHRIVLRNWFHDVTHQRVIFKTGDGVLFKVSATITEDLDLIAYALSGSTATTAQTYDAQLPQFVEVYAIAGSEYNDILYGNDLDNQLNGGGGDDQITGGQGKDSYVVDLNKGVDTINNFATDGAVDSLVIGTALDELIFSSREDSSDLYITQSASSGDESNTGAVIKNWFLNETYRHMVVVTKDKAVVKVSAIKNLTVSYQPLIVNMTDIRVEEQLVTPGEPFVRVLNLNTDPIYSEVMTVIGTPGNDSIIGNGKDNYITGAQGFDHIEGREGADTYAVRAGDGSKRIVNCAKDHMMDTLLFDTRFDDIELDSPNGTSDLVLTGDGIEVTLVQWFRGSQCQHMMARSVDGVTFSLPNMTSNNTTMTATAKAIDNSNLTTNVQLVLTGKWEQVERVTGSQGDDSIVGNSLNNYIDPGRGNSYLQGRNGSDTYVIQSTYGEENVINNYAEDDLTDTLLFLVPFLNIQTEVVNNGVDIQMSSLSGDGLVRVRLVDYNLQVGEHMRHLIVTTSDGISFVLPVANSSNIDNYKPIPVSINMAQAATGQHLHLTQYTTFTEVRTVYGSSRYQNTIIGNAQNNTLAGGIKADLIQGLDGDDTLKGGDGNDIIEGGSGNDILVGGDGDDRLDGGDHNDVLSPGTGVNTVNGGLGTDTVLYSGDVTKEEGIVLSLSTGTCVHDGNSQDTLSGIENVYGTAYDDILEGDDEDNVLVGQNGTDYLSPGTGYDILNGGNGNDTYDLTEANGTVTIENYAPDKVYDLVILGYANISDVWYEIVGKDVVIRVINTEYPVFYDGNKPAVIFKRFMAGSTYQHVNLETADGTITDLSAFVTVTAEPTAPPQSPGVGTGYYVAMGLLVVTLCVFVGLVVVGVYKVRSNRKVRYIHLN